MRKILGGVLLFVLLCSSVAFAQGKAGPVKARPAADACAELRRREPLARCKTIEIDGEEIDVTLHKPDVDVLGGRGGTQFTSLIKVRRSFTDKIVASADNL